MTRLNVNSLVSWSMKKWLEEKILIKYWTENCTKYSLRDGRKIRSAQHSLPFDSYPDIQKNELDDGTIVPAEVEWNTSNFDRHGHDISVLIENNGFLIVLEKDKESFPVEQVEINKNDFLTLINLIKKIGNFKRLKIKSKKNLFYETKILRLSSNKAKKQINYIPKLSLKESIRLTVDWYKSYFKNRKKILKFTQLQIQSYFKKWLLLEKE